MKTVIDSFIYFFKKLFVRPLWELCHQGFCAEQKGQVPALVALTFLSVESDNKYSKRQRSLQAAVGAVKGGEHFNRMESDLEGG